MALVNRSENQQQSTSNFGKDENIKGYLNISVIAKDGTRHSLSRGIPLSELRKVDRSLLAAAEAQGDNLELTLEGSVHILGKDQETIEF